MYTRVWKCTVIFAWMLNTEPHSCIWGGLQLSSAGTAHLFLKTTFMVFLLRHHSKWCQWCFLHISWQEFISNVKFYAVLAYSKSHSLFVYEDSVFSAMLPDSHVLYQQIQSFESAPRWEMVNSHRTNGGMPGSTRSAVTWVLQRTRPCNWHRLF